MLFNKGWLSICHRLVREFTYEVSQKFIMLYDTSPAMTARVHEQRRMRESVDELFRTSDDVEIIKEKLESLGFLERAEKMTLVVMENPDLELYVQIDLTPGENIKNYDVLTFEEIEDALR